MKNAVFMAENRPFLLGCVLNQIVDKSPNTFDEAIIYHNGMNETDKEALNKIIPCRFVEYNPPFSDDIFLLDSFDKFSALMFARYEIFSLIEDYDRIMWIDSDVLVQGNLQELLEIGDETGFALVREDLINCSNFKPDINRTNFKTAISGYNMETPLYCSGLMVITKKLGIQNDYTKWCYEKTGTYADKLYLPDQGILNLLIQEFNIDVSLITPGATYCCYPALGRDCGFAKIIHAWGDRKFWNNWYLYNEFPEWKTSYDKWIKLGGTPYKKECKPDISVIIPTYKPNLDYFEICIKSLLKQKNDMNMPYENFEIIIVSEPFMQEEIKDFVDSFDDPRIRLFFNDKRKGISASLNRAIKESKADFIARMDDDDIAYKTRLFKQYTLLSVNESIHMCPTDFYYFGDMNRYVKAPSGEDAKAMSLLTCPYDHPTVMFKKQFFIENNLYYDEERFFVEDWELWCRAFDKGMQVKAINEPLLKHRWHKNQAGQNYHTYIMMKLLRERNIIKLGVKPTPTQLSIISPWIGKIRKENYFKLYKFMKKLIKANRKTKLYDEESLKKILHWRFQEAVFGKPSYDSFIKNYVKSLFKDGFIMLIKVVRKIRKDINIFIEENRKQLEEGEDILIE